MKLKFVTSNENKLKEASSILEFEIENEPIDLTEIQDIGVEKIVENKIKEAYTKIKKPVIVEDTGLYLNSINGFPGALVKWVLKTIGDKGIYDLVKDKEKSAYAKTSIGYYDGNELKIFSGTIKGQITEPKGSTNFGWDTIFKPEGWKKSFSEMPKEEKNKISMRKKAFEKLKNYLESEKANH